MVDPKTGATSPDIEAIAQRHRRAIERRQHWEGVWRDCYTYALPQRDSAVGETTPGSVKTARLFDGTAPDGVERLAASLLAELTPPWSRWFSLVPGRAVGDSDDDAVLLEDAAEIVRAHFERSNFAVEMHQAFLDLVTVGTASLLFEEAAPGAPSAFQFASVPLGEAAFEEGPDGRLGTTFRRSVLQPEVFRERFPEAATTLDDARGGSDRDRPVTVIEAVTRAEDGYRYHAFLDNDAAVPGAAAAASPDTAKQLSQGRFARSPFINFRWMKAPGEIYGRSPVMKALPDIKTANSRAGIRTPRTARSCSRSRPRTAPSARACGSRAVPCTAGSTIRPGAPRTITHVTSIRRGRGAARRRPRSAATCSTTTWNRRPRCCT